MLLGLALIAALGLVLAGLVLTSDTVERTASWSAALADTKAHVTESHIWLEERVSGDKTIDVERQILANDTVATGLVRALRGGGTVGGQTIRGVTDDGLSSELSVLQTRIADIRALTRKRLRGERAAGSARPWTRPTTSSSSRSSA